MIVIKKILVITSSIDETVDYMIEKYQEKNDFFRVNIDCFSKYDFHLTRNGWMISNGKHIITLDNTKAIYYRKPIFPDLSEIYPRYHSMIQKDIIAIVNGIVDSFDGPVISKPYILRKTENKAFQLLVAQKFGMKLPDSYIGNTNSVAKKYSEKSSIIKPISTGKVIGDNKTELFYTQKFDYFDDDIKLTPIYLQEFVKKAYEVRLTIINNNCYAVRIDAENMIDWRTDYSKHKYSIIRCPDDIKMQCKNIMYNFGLVFGAFDFIVDINKNWYFLEINPNGQWLWLEKALNLNISDQIIDFLKGDE